MEERKGSDTLQIADFQFRRCPASRDGSAEIPGSSAAVKLNQSGPELVLDGRATRFHLKRTDSLRMMLSRSFVRSLFRPSHVTTLVRLDRSRKQAAQRDRISSAKRSAHPHWKEELTHLVQTS
ncbi:hypothetical protein PHSY_004781 [Pseudozyma hubeiensis SY62]|uniref:Uncharacterized protein n=1 Tax=Pseudozyma hubeiensis (strain SY62) TaxID=1305764 RepID=R9P762_PSEHS|nr:hypothetical protein PHSY_004781 [Pseudozyma hubeiensis SY62]GAC97196.1 hypothetical protein PHSY_004781 [Pseudozyma hubeiensis SY62]